MSISEHIKNTKELDSKGRCLHFDSGNQCDNIIAAHSIQKSGQLKHIAENNHVMRVNSSLGALIKNEGKPSISKVGWNKASTFNGFCKKHDNDLFKPIDEHSLLPNSYQIMLYAYRCLCREYFVKENSRDLAKEYANDSRTKSPMTMGNSEGTDKGFNTLKYHKQAFDASLENGSYDDIVYVCFSSDDAWHIQFSGLFYPDFDFMGRGLQDLGNLDHHWDLVTFFTAPMSTGWAFVLAWHKNSHEACSIFTSSLAESMQNGKKVEDSLFRLGISCCENHAFRPSWWDGLTKEDKNRILAVVQDLMHPLMPIRPNYLANGLEGIASWSYDKVHPSANSHNK